MKKYLFALGLMAGAIAPAMATTNVGVSVGINQPGVYGRVDIGNFPPPAVIYSQPVVIAPTPVAVYQQPIYLYVPPGHQKNWGKHCYRYGACGQPVYFVREQWVRDHYHGDDRGRDRDDDDDDRGRHHKRKHKHGRD